MRFFAKLALWCLRFSDEKTKSDILTESTKHLFCAISSDDILKHLPDGTMRFEDKTLDSSFKKELKIQANVLENMMLWRVLQKDIQYQVRKKMFEEAELTGDMRWGKLLLWMQDVIKSRINQLQK